MRIAAGIVGILVGILSIFYIGLFGGLLGSATSWLGSGPWSHGDSRVTNLGEMITLLSYLSGILAIVGGIVAFSNTRVGGIILGASAFLHWYLLGFGVIGKVFILPIGVAAAFAFFAAPSNPESTPLGATTETPSQSYDGSNTTAVNFDRAKWDALVKYDKDIALIAEKLQPLGQKWLDEFASSYLALNDKTYLPEIETKIVAAAKAEAGQNEKKKIYEEEQRKIYLQEQERLAQARRAQLELWKVRLWGTMQRKLWTTIISAFIVLLVLTVALWPKPLIIKVKARDGRFIAYDNGTVLDSKTNLMWAAKDNGSNINWEDAKSYCEKYHGGGYTDWRMPTQDELALLYGSYNPSKIHLAACDNRMMINITTNLIDITCIELWASETRGADAARFGFRDGEKYLYPKFGYSRVLPVRFGKGKGQSSRVSTMPASQANKGESKIETHAISKITIKLGLGDNSLPSGSYVNPGQNVSVSAVRNGWCKISSSSNAWVMCKGLAAPAGGWPKRNGFGSVSSSGK